MSKVHPLFQFDLEYTKQFGTIIGTDEVGRGPLAGPVVAAAVILDLENPIDGINDSKKLSEKQRELLFPKIRAHAKYVKATVIMPAEIDRINILQASLKAMYKSILPCSQWEYILVDGNKTISQFSNGVQETIVKGDSKSASIAAASIIAKVVHDRILKKYHEKWPQYNFLSNKGYPTKEHREAILQYGITPVHRISFCEKLLSQQSFL